MQRWLLKSVEIILGSTYCHALILHETFQRHAWPFPLHLPVAKNDIQCRKVTFKTLQLVNSRFSMNPHEECRQCFADYQKLGMAYVMPSLNGWLAGPLGRPCRMKSPHAAANLVPRC